MCKLHFINFFKQQLKCKVFHPNFYWRLGAATCSSPNKVISVFRIWFGLAAHPTKVYLGFGPIDKATWKMKWMDKNVIYAALCYSYKHCFSTRRYLHEQMKSDGKMKIDEQIKNDEQIGINKQIMVHEWIKATLTFMNFLVCFSSHSLVKICIAHYICPC